MTASTTVSGYAAATQPRADLVYGGLFAAAALAFAIGNLRLGLPTGAMDMLALVGNATCGWAWLAIRTTFRPPGARTMRWPLAVVLAIVLLEALAPSNGADASQIARMIGNLAGLLSSAVLLMAAIEPLRGFDNTLPLAERRFRLLFFGSYLAILTIAVIWVDSSPSSALAAAGGVQIKAWCAIAAAIGICAAIWYRVLNPMSAPHAKTRPAADPSAAELAPRIRELLEGRELYTSSELRVADIAAMLAEPEYKVTQAITRGLGYPNFNRMVNHYRIASAMSRLSDPKQRHLPVLTIALDCGFGSIGPFNRAFKEATGMTPSAYRAQRA